MSDENADSSELAPFERDFGYLDKFLVAVHAHAQGVEGARGDRLRALLAGEVERFAEVRRLLGGAEPESGSDVAPPTVSASDPDAGPAESRPRSSAAAARPGREFTVGSLLRDRRRDEGSAS